MRFRCHVCKKETPASQAKMRTHGGDRPLAVCPRCVKKSEATKRNIQQITAKHAAAGYVSECVMADNPQGTVQVERLVAYSKQVEALRQNVLGSIGMSFPPRVAKKCGMEHRIAMRRYELSVRFYHKNESNPFKREAEKRAVRKYAARGKEQEKQFERKQNKAPRGISLGRSLEGNEAADAKPGDEKD